MSATGQSWFGSAALAASACASVPGDPKNRLLMRSRKDEPPLEGAGAESTRFDEQPATAMASMAAASPCPRTPSPHPVMPNHRAPPPYSSPKVALPRPPTGPDPRLEPDIGSEQRVEQVVLPQPVDAEIFPGKSLAREAGLLQETHRCNVAGDARGLETMQPESAEHERNERIDGRRHQAAARVGLADPITEASGLGDAAAHIGERQSAHQRIVGAAEQEERVGLVGAQILGVTLQAPPKGAARQIVVQPGRFPRRQELAALLPQAGPFGKIGHLRRPQVDAVSFHDGERLREGNRAEERHRSGRHQRSSAIVGRSRASGIMTEIRSAEFRIRRLVRKLAHAARRNRLSAIVAALSRSRLGPSAATAGRLRLIRLTPAARALSTVTASTLATISSSGIGRP